jgi:hypothetical protein
MLCRTGDHGLRLCAQQGAVGVCYRVAGKLPTAAIAFRSSILAQFEGRSHDLVTLEELESGKGRACWTEGAIPRIFNFDTVPLDTVPDLPKPPKERASLPSSFLDVLDQAAQSTANESGRYALGHIQLRGQSGEVVATDGKQLLMQSGFSFPWNENLLVPSIRAFGLRDLATDENIRIGRIAKEVVICVGPWTFLLGIESNRRYPEVQEVIPRPSTFTCRLRVDPEDATFLINVIPKLAGHGDDHSPITLDLNGKTLVRAREENGGATTEVELARSRVEGKPMRVSLNRMLVRRAMMLGCTEFGFASPEKPVLARDESRLLVLMPLEERGVIPPNKSAICISSASPFEVPRVPSVPSEPLNPGRPVMPAPNPNGHSANGSSETAVTREGGPSIGELFAEGEELRNLLQDASVRLSRLLSGLKQHRRQSRAMQAAMQSLRQLKLDG